MPPALQRRGYFGVGEGDDTRRQPIVRDCGMPFGVEFEAGEDFVVIAHHDGNLASVDGR